jgi:uncharacterized protein YciI
MADREMVFMFFTTGKSVADVPREELTALQKRHIENLERLYHAGLSPLAGPLADPDKKRRGIVLLNLKGTEAVREHFQPDPYVTQGFMQIEAHKVRVPVQDLGKPSETEISEHRIALLEPTSPLDQRVIHDISFRLRKLPGSERPRLLAVREKGDGFPAIFALFLASDDDSVRKTLQAVGQEPVRDTDWKVWRQWCSKGVLKP